MPGEFTVTFGNGVTVTVATAVLVQLFKVPVTVYVVVVVNTGVVGFDTPVKPPVQLYVVAPLAVKLAVVPLQMVGEFTVTVGRGFTVTVDTAVPVQPCVLPVTVYVVVVVNTGVTALGEPLNPPVHV
jgi:hypothetical protein